MLIKIFDIARLRLHGHQTNRVFILGQLFFRIVNHRLTVIYYFLLVLHFIWITQHLLHSFLLSRAGNKHIYKPMA